MDTYRRKFIEGKLWVEEAYVDHLENEVNEARAQLAVANAKLQCRDEEIARMQARFLEIEKRPGIPGSADSKTTAPVSQ